MVINNAITSADYSSCSDKELFFAIREGNNLAFNELYERYFSKFTDISYGIVQDRPAAEDIVQDRFMAIFNSGDSLERIYERYSSGSDTANLSGYLFRAVISRSLNYVRDRKRKEKYIGCSADTFEYINQEDTDENGLEDQLDQLVANRIIFRAINRLPDTHKEIISYRLVKGFTAPETANILGVKEGTVHSRLNRAKKKLVLMSPHLEDLLRTHF